MAEHTPASWTDELLRRIDAPETIDPRAAVLAWVNAEGGHWHNTATHNPLNTSRPGFGGVSAGLQQPNIKAYPTWEDGFGATVATLNNGLYGPVLSALRAGDGQGAVTAIGNSRWGTHLATIQRRYDELRRTPMANVIGGPVKPHVQGFANECQEATGQTAYSTYPSHLPSQDRALDMFATKAFGDAVCAWILTPENWRRFGCRYLIWQQHINYNDGRGWTLMAYIPGPRATTDNHFDHMHLGFEVTAPGPFDGVPTEGGDDLVAVTDEVIWTAQTLADVKELIGKFARFAPDVEGDDWAKGRVGFERLFLAINERTEVTMPKLDSHERLLSQMAGQLQSMSAILAKISDRLDEPATLKG